MARRQGPFERMVATRKWFATPSVRVARERALFLTQSLGRENARGSTETSGELLGPSS